MGPVIMLTPPSASLPVGDSTVFYVTTVPKTGVRWTSSDPAVATVSATGVVRAITVGETTITVSQVPGPSTAAAALVVVHAP
jgi:lactocepin